MWSQVGCVQQLGEPLLDGTEVQIAGGRQPTTEHEHLWVEQVREVAEAERDPVTELVDHPQRFLVALASSSLDVLATNVERVTTGQLQHPTQPLGDRSLAGQRRQAAARRVALPTAAPPARAWQPLRVDHHVTDLA